MKQKPRTVYKVTFAYRGLMPSNERVGDRIKDDQWRYVLALDAEDAIAKVRKELEDARHKIVIVSAAFVCVVDID